MYLRPLQTLAHNVSAMHMRPHGSMSLGCHQAIKMSVCSWTDDLRCLISSTAPGAQQQGHHPPSPPMPTSLQHTSTSSSWADLGVIVRERVHSWQQENLRSKEPILWVTVSLQERKLAHFQRWRENVILKGQAGVRRNVYSSVLSSVDCVGLRCTIISAQPRDRGFTWYMMGL